MNEETDPRELISENADIHPALRMMINMGENLFITGPAGTGKSYIINELVKNSRDLIHVSASTGLAAMNIKGCTVHSLLGFRTASHPKQLNSVVKKPQFSYAEANLQAAKVIVIDEVSMLKAGQMDLISALLKYIKFHTTTLPGVAPFGGVQLLIFGDLLQLPPVTQGNEDKTNYLWPFESEVWEQANIKTVALSKIYRQQDAAFTSVLNKVRRGIVDTQVRELLMARSRAQVPAGVRPLRFAATNKEVADGNVRELEKLRGGELHFHGKVDATGTRVKLDMYQEYFEKNSRMDMDLIVKAGAPIVMLCNRKTLTENFVNGSMGKFIGISSRGLPQVELYNADGKSEVTEINKHVDEMTDSKGNIVATFTQMPFRLAYYTTYHKCQGMTLDYVELDMARAWEYGMIYTGLSRVRTLSGLFIKNLKISAIKAHPKALKFYGYIK